MRNSRIHKKARKIALSKVRNYRMYREISKIILHENTTKQYRNDFYVKISDLYSHYLNVSFWSIKKRGKK